MLCFFNQTFWVTSSLKLLHQILILLTYLYLIMTNTCELYSIRQKRENYLFKVLRKEGYFVAKRKKTVTVAA